MRAGMGWSKLDGFVRRLSFLKPYLPVATVGYSISVLKVTMGHQLTHFWKPFERKRAELGILQAMKCS